MEKTSDYNLSVFSKKQFVGGYVPRQTADMLGLTALVLGISRTAVLKRGLDKVLLPAEDVPKILDGVAKSLHVEFKRRKRIELRNYIVTVKKNLRRKRIPKTYIKEIIDRLRSIDNDEKKNKTE